ncbi:hypothetical protein PISMIDRAFT_116774, partial [Pisolithus microcarpus 441]
MHHCLSIDEILREIFRCIESRSTLYALARTCRTFSDPAVDRIWETLTAIEPALLKNLSSARFVTNRFDSARPVRVHCCLALLHPLNDGDWNTIRRLSSRVRRLHINLRIVLPWFDETDVPPQWFYQLASPPDSSFLFPNLR